MSENLNQTKPKLLNYVALILFFSSPSSKTFLSDLVVVLSEFDECLNLFDKLYRVKSQEFISQLALTTFPVVVFTSRPNGAFPLTTTYH